MRSSPPPRRPQGGFTLLEVMAAFAILAVTTAYLTQIFVDNVDKGTTALAHRELREAADTIFRKMIYERDTYKDGEERRLDEDYGEFADLKGWQRDRWAIYRYRLDKKLKTVVGAVSESGESLFERDTDDYERQPVEGEEGEAGQGGIELLEMTLRIFYTEDENSEPLLVLSTWIDPEKGSLQR